MSLQLKIVGTPITSICNLKCTHCLRGTLNKYNGFNWTMSLDQAEQIAAKLYGYTQYVNLSAGYGEPFLNPDVVSIIRIFKERGLKTILYSNATAETHKGIINSDIHLLLLSLDKYHILWNKDEIIKLLQVYQFDKKFADRLHLNVVLQPNEDESDFINYIFSLCERFPSIYAEFHWRNEYGNTSQSMNIMPLKYYSLFTSSDHIIAPSFNYYPQNKCKDIFNSLYFDEFGNVRTCCIFMRANPQLNIYEKEIPQIFYSKFLERKRKMFLSHNGFQQCKTCPIGHGYIW